MSDLVAYHEAGHALVALLLGGDVQSVTIEPDHDDGPRRDGDTQVLWRRGSLGERRFAEVTVQVSLAGPVAEMLYTGEPYHPGGVAEWGADWRDALAAASLLVPDPRRRVKYLEQHSVKLHRQLGDDPLWSALASLADHLLAHETLDGEAVREIVEPWLA